MNLAYKYPIVFWNCACLISDAGGAESEDDENEDEDDDVYVDVEYEEIEDFGDESEDDDEEEEEVKTSEKKKKKKTANYGKIATAIGKIKMAGIEVAPPHINASSYTFSPDAENNIIRYGMSGITRIGDDLVKEIIANRPYTSIEDFLSKVKVNKPQMINLIKSGAFDCFGERESIMREYVNLVSDTKKRITLQNLKMLIDFGLIPDEYDLQRRIFNYNRYLKKLKNGEFYDMDEIAFGFFEKNFDIDLLTPAETESGFKIKQTTWDSIYKKHQDIIRPFIQKNATDLLEQVNSRLTKETWDKYCLGNRSKWEMDSVSYYSSEHELARVNNSIYGFADYFELPQNPEIERMLPIKGKTVPIFKLHRICGTVLDRDKAKKTVTLLTTTGVVTVKVYGQVFNIYDKQLSERGADGKKHVTEKSVFSRGNKIIVTGIRQGDEFLAKKYSKTPYHLVEEIVQVNDDGTIITHHRNDNDE